MRIKQKQPKKTHKFILVALLALLLLGAALFAGVRLFTPEADHFSVTTQKIFVQNVRGTYTLAEIALPKEVEGDLPLVTVAHGFTGSINSGGAKELVRRLAASGIAAVRLDFDSYLEPSEDAARAHQYTLKDMQDDTVSIIHYMRGHYPIDTSRIGLYARSMGGRAAMMMANESYGGYDYAAMALVAPAGSANAMVYFMGGEQAWAEMKNEAAKKGFVPYKQLRLTPEWFSQFDDYDPCDHGLNFGAKPVLVICNTLDYVVTDETSKACAAAYRNARVIEVTTQDHHGYEMSKKDSTLKDDLMNAIVLHFHTSLF